MEKNNKYLVNYLDYLKYQKNYSDYTVLSYGNDIEEFFEYIIEKDLILRILNMVI